MIIQTGEKPNSQMSSAETTGIHMLYRFIRADLAMLNVGAAISATTAGRMPLNMRSTMVLSLKLWKNNAMARMMRNEGSMVPNAVIMLPRIHRSRYPIKMDILTARMPGADCDIASRSMKSSLAIQLRLVTISFSISGTMA